MAKGVFQVTLSPFDCAGCFKKIEEQLARMNGIQSVKVFPQLARVRIEFKASEVSLEKLEAAIESLGFPVESKKLS
jgi:copper chaperone CopZ